MANILSMSNLQKHFCVTIFVGLQDKLSLWVDTGKELKISFRDHKMEFNIHDIEQNKNSFMFVNTCYHKKVNIRSMK